ncbi:MAG: ThiJ/PfpI domain-containing protein [Parcubacteria group bacterium GW2011_GWE2_38_18]|nr:MAG: ThiJ/PfpI domain-containing protein [Parcubacteria group bacterium GW2011_GWE2_38_18]
MINKKFLILISLFLILFVSGCVRNIFTNKKEAAINSKKVLLVVSPINFFDEEYQAVRNELEKNDIEVKIASIQGPIAKGLNGTETRIDLLTSEAKAEDFSAVIFIGGKEVELISDDDTLKLLAFQFKENNKIVAAIDNAPVILAKSGILLNRKATVVASLKGQLVSIGKANLIEESVVVDGSIITANSPAASEDFIRRIIEKIND